MTAEAWELQAILNDLGLQEYLELLIQHGFDTWDNLVGIKETDMETIGIKLGHRRKLQREISRRLGHDINDPLYTGNVRSEQGDEADGSSTQAERPKRRYRRRAPRDPHAPVRPDTAYVSYAKFLRQDPKVAKLSFVDIAKLVGERWAHLSEDLKEVWIQNAEASRVEYKDAMAQYHETAEYQAHLENTRSKLSKKNDKVDDDTTISQNPSPEAERNGCSSTAGGEASESPICYSNNSHQAGHRVPTNDSTAPPSRSQTVNASEPSPLSSQGLSVTSTGLSIDVEPDVPVIESIWKMISLEQSLNPEHSPTQLNYDDLLSYNFRRSSLSSGLDVQALNPFNFLAKATIKPFLDSFLQDVNTVYYLINPDDLWSYLDSTFDMSVETSDLFMSIVCICIALGCQTCPTGDPGMSILWYENGRRYLDNHDWNIDPIVMQILAMISMYHMAQRPATSSHYLDTAIRIGKANNLDTAIKDVGGSGNAPWLDIWNTMMDMNRILLLGSGANKSILRTFPPSPNGSEYESSTFTQFQGLQGIEASPYRFIRAESSSVTSPLSDLLDILGAIQQRNQIANMAPWEVNAYLQKLETWLQCLPDDLTLPTISGSQHIDQSSLRDTISSILDQRKPEVLHLYSLYFGTISLLLSPSLQRVVTKNPDHALSQREGDEQNAYNCLNSATRMTDICAAFFNVFPFPVFAWLPQSILFTSSLTCILGIFWQRRVARELGASYEWLDRSNQSLVDALHIMKYCGLGNVQCQRHYLVLQRLFDWLQRTSRSPSIELGNPYGTVDPSLI